MQLAQDLEARAIRQVDVEEDEVRPIAQGALERFARRVRDTDHGERLKPLDEAAVDLGDAEIVLDDEGPDRPRGDGTHVRAAGMSAVKTAPPSLAARTQPPRRWATCRTSASPMP